MRLRDVDIHIYKIDDNGTFEGLGEINKFTSLMWPDKFSGYTTFELNAPVTPENKRLIKKGHVIWCGGDNACMIEVITYDSNQDGEKFFKVRGRTLEMILTTRIIWGTYTCRNKIASTAMYEIVNSNCVNPANIKRKIPFLECAQDERVGKSISYQKTGGEVYSALEAISSDSELGFDVIFKPKEKKLIFKVTEGVDRTLMLAREGSDLVVFSTDLEDILTSSYYTNNQDLKNVAYIAGEDTGVERKSATAGSPESKGLARRELYVDARELQAEVLNDDGTTTSISEEEYTKMLLTKGDEKLSECMEIESFEAEMRVVGDIQYVYGKDYFKGDKVLIQDTELGVQIIAKVTEVSENFDDEYELLITFGYTYPTLIQKIKRQIL